MSFEPNAARFDGFAEQYDEVRPTPPEDLGRLLRSYAGRADHVVDVGAGSGLSTRWVAGWADRVTGIEPGDEMRLQAAAAAPELTFRAGWGHDTGLESGCADLVTCVQAFHWMEPTATLAEFARLLRPGGVFAAIDCDWPPAVGSVAAERAWSDCRATIRVLERRVAEGASVDELARPVRGSAEWAAYDGVDPHRDRVLADGVRSWPKSGHLDQLRASGRFDWVREVVTHALEPGDAERFVGLLRSQGDYRTLRRHGLTDEQLGADELERVARTELGGPARPWVFTYRARIGVVAPR
ncbi:MAG: class I SAM-dependent methyltransferase [Actinomycetota bacterium]